jgi:VanZ family protein
MIKKNIFSIIVAIIIAYLSLSGSESFESSFFTRIPYYDKIAHLMMYFGFMSVIIFENRKVLRTGKNFIIAAIIPFLWGGLMEILQASVTVNRSGDLIDALFNLCGILIAIAIYRLFCRQIK